MVGEGPFLWINERGPPSGFFRAPPGGLCICAFLFVRNGPRILLGKYAEDSRWEELAGLDPDRVRRHGKGWTIPARHLKFGEDPRDAARHVGESILGIRGMRYAGPRVAVETYESSMAPGQMHSDIWFLFDAPAPKEWVLRKPAWYADLAWHDPRRLPGAEYARGHEDVVRRWLEERSRARRTLEPESRGVGRSSAARGKL